MLRTIKNKFSATVSYSAFNAFKNVSFLVRPKMQAKELSSSISETFLHGFLLSPHPAHMSKTGYVKWALKKRPSRKKKKIAHCLQTLYKLHDLHFFYSNRQSS